MYRPGKSTASMLVSILILTSGCVSEAIYHPTHEIRHTPAHAGLAYEDVTLETSDAVRLSAWWVPAATPRGAVLFCHGNAGNIGDRLDTLLIINSLGLDVLIFDYRGYGSSHGSPTEQGTYLDAEAAWNYLVRQKKIAPGQIIVWGRSLGGAVAARTAAEHPAGLVIVESGFTSLEALVHDHIGWVPSWILSDYAYDTLYYLENISAPVLVIHSPDDEIVPFRHGKELYGSIKGPKAFVEIHGSHNRGFIDSLKVYASSIDDFIKVYFREKEVHSE